MTYYVAPAPTDATHFVPFLDYLQGKEKKALGFLPFQALARAINMGRVLLCYENDEPAGYCIHGPTKAHGKIYQVVVADDARRIEHGTALVEAVLRRMNAANAETLSLHCAEDLEANSFWQYLDFRLTGKRCKRKDRKRFQNRYEIELPGKALADMLRKLERKRITQELEASGLTKLRELLLKGNPNMAKVTFSRKNRTGHEIYEAT